ncbi:MAG: alpha/beta hydrolase [Ectothiorhodospiraceae bacterium]|nr:alpha/beta hydrolase [Ectothiorhodospiraceae bacterium]
MEQFTLKAHDGLTLHCRSWTAPGRLPRACVVLVHGLGEHSGRYGELADHLTTCGFQVYAFDTRGHGATAGDPECLGILPAESGWDDWIRDIGTLVQHARERHPDTPIFLLGHSLGSLMCQHYAAVHGETIDGLILSATDSRPGLGTRITHWGGTLFKALQGRNRRSRLLYALGVGNMKRSLPDRRTDQDWISRDESIVDAYLADPLCGFQPSNGMWHAIAQGMEEISNRLRGRIPSDLPVLMLVGTGDLLSLGGQRVRALMQAYRQHGARRVNLISYPEARHEVFNEINRQEVYRDLSNWLDQHLTDDAPSADAARGEDPLAPEQAPAH